MKKKFSGLKTVRVYNVFTILICPLSYHFYSVKKCDLCFVICLKMCLLFQKTCLERSKETSCGIPVVRPH